jgi:hypothetical protein
VNGGRIVVTLNNVNSNVVIRRCGPRPLNEPIDG